MKVWDTAAQRLLGELPGHRSYVADIAISADGSRAAVIDGASVVRLWDLSSFELIGRFDGHHGQYGTVGQGDAVAFTPNGEFLFSGGGDKDVMMVRTLPKS